MTRDQLVSLLERERVSYPDQLEAERYRPGALVRAHTPITEEQAARNFAALKQFADREGDHE